MQFVSEDSGSQTRIYRLDAAALSPQKRATKPTPELERETHDILGRTVDDLKDRTFQVLRIDPVLDGDGAVLHYDVTVRVVGESRGAHHGKPQIWPDPFMSGCRTPSAI